ncbi:hypothetical protein D3C71_1714170 [compost metagenome]
MALYSRSVSSRLHSSRSGFMTAAAPDATPKVTASFREPPCDRRYTMPATRLSPAPTTLATGTSGAVICSVPSLEISRAPFGPSDTTTVSDLPSSISLLAAAFASSSLASVIPVSSSSSRAFGFSRKTPASAAGFRASPEVSTMTRQFQSFTAVITLA